MAVPILKDVNDGIIKKFVTMATAALVNEKT